MAKTDSTPLVGIVMGSDSDLPVMAKAADMLEELGIGYEIRIISAPPDPLSAGQIWYSPLPQFPCRQDCKAACPPFSHSRYPPRQNEAPSSPQSKWTEPLNEAFGEENIQNS